MCLLREMFGSGVEKIKIDRKVFTTPSKAKIEITTLSSNYHIEMSPSEAGFHDRIVVQEILKEIAQTQQLGNSPKPFKVVILNDVDQLSKQAQHALRRTMEKYVSTCRLILSSSNSSKIISPIRSRCLSIRVSAPSQEEIMRVLEKISQSEGIELPVVLAERIATVSERNLRKAILTLEACKAKSSTLTEKSSIPITDWEQFLKETSSKILGEQTPQRLLEIRSRLYELMSHCIPPSVIIKTLCSELIKNLDNSLKVETIHWAAFYEHRIQCGSKSIYHLEAFVAKFMSIYKAYLTDMCM
eukprot:Sdes_comp19900_c0_seq3m12282